MNGTFDGTTYQYESGGDPECIPNLTYEDFIGFHKKYYSPTNSYIFLYGKMDMEERMDFLDKEYLSKFEKIDVNPIIKKSESQEKLVEKEIFYPIAQNEILDNKTNLGLGIALTGATDIKDDIAFTILDRILINSPSGIIKNKLLAKLEQIDPGHIDQHFNNWNYLLNYLGDDYTVQERFFRQYYNAFNNEFKPIIKDVQNASVATRSNLIKIYEKLIVNDANGFFEEILQAGKCYSFILNPKQEEWSTSLSRPLKDLERIQGAPSYLFLLFVLLKKERCLLEEMHLNRIIQLLVRFFVRRNLTDTPPTRDLTRLFMNLINKIDGLKGDEIVRVVEQELVAVSANDEVFRRLLEGPVYSENSEAVRFILCALEEKAKTRENMVDLWAMEGKRYVWTIEHIFPQGENIPQPWIDMIAEGDKNRAKELQVKYVDRLGNLTISGYNSNLGNKSFEEKRDRKDKQGRYIGYLNRLYLNEDLVKTDKWNIESIDSRTSRLVEETLNLFALKEKE